MDGKTWKRVPSLEHSKPTDRVYILREDTDGHCTVKFGDGITGARVPTGTGCMAATYRVGVGAYGNVRGTRTEKIVTEDDHAAALIESMVRIGDELSRYQDMVAQQAYLGTARTRRRLEKHAQKLGYQLHAGMSMLNLLLTLMDSKTTVTSQRLLLSSCMIMILMP